MKFVLNNKDFHEVFFYFYQIIDTNSCWSTIILMFHVIIQTSVITQSLIKSSQWAKKRKKTVQSGERGTTKLAKSYCSSSTFPAIVYLSSTILYCSSKEQFLTQETREIIITLLQRNKKSPASVDCINFSNFNP